MVQQCETGSTGPVPLFAGITATTVQADRLAAKVLTRTGRCTGGTVVAFLHGNVPSSLFCLPIMLALAWGMAASVLDLRSFDGSECAPVDPTHGVRDVSDDVHSVVRELGLGPVRLVGWSIGGGVVMHYALDHPVAGITLQAPVSPSGFGGTRPDVAWSVRKDTCVRPVSNPATLPPWNSRSGSRNGWWLTCAVPDCRWA